MDNRKTQITRAAMTVFARYGLRRSSMLDVAREVGLSRPALYQYFDGKNDLIAACIDEVIEAGFSAGEAALEGIEGVRNRVLAYLIGYRGFYHRLLITGPHSREMLVERSRLGPEKVSEVGARLVARLNGLAGREPGDELGEILAHAGEGLQMRASDEEVLARRLGALVRGLLAD
jgi:TetR/AcrR family transcriptional regulator